MSALERIERLLIAIATGISQHTLIPLYIPKPTALDIIESDSYDPEEQLESFLKRDLTSGGTAEKYAQILAICSVCAEVLEGNGTHNHTCYNTAFVANKTITQRDVYYCLKHLFKTQAQCNAIILETGLLLSLKRCS